MKRINEKELHLIFQNLINNDKTAYSKFYEKYYNLVYGVAFSIMKNKSDSEDITNDVFTKILTLDRAKLPVSSEASWLFTVTRNECFSNLRKKKQSISIEEIYEIPLNSKELQDIVDIDYYNDMISNLNEQEKTIVSLKIISNFTFKKISQIMNIPIGTVQWKYYKAINTLKFSIGSVAGAVLAFVFAFVRGRKLQETPYTNKENYSTNNSEHSQNVIENEREYNVNNYSPEQDSIKNDAVVPIPNETSTGKLYEEMSNIKVIDPLLIGTTFIGIIFLLVFIIFFKKYQQTFHKKASK